MNNEAAINVRNLTKVYNLYNKPSDRIREAFHPLRKKYHQPFYALQQVSFDVKKGETLGIIGRNGSGKSTLLQIICGILQPSSGTISTTGRISALLELGSGFNPEFSGRDNVFLNAAILGLSREEIQSKLDDILAFADIGSFIDQKVNTYSSGMMIRLAFAVMAHVDADILVIDEALAVGDIFFVQKCMRWLRDFQKRGILIFVTHDLGALTGLCKKAIWLHEGKICAQGPAKQISEAYLEAFIKDREKEQNAMNGATAENSSTNQNHNKYSEHSPNAKGFGRRDAHITEIELRDCTTGKLISHIMGGEKVRLSVRCCSESTFLKPIVGFYCKNQFGQELFGDNTDSAFRDKNIIVTKGECFHASFKFQMPVLPAGDYTFTIALANGDQDNHIICHWLHDAIAIKSSTDGCQGLVGIPMDDIELAKTPHP